MTVRLNEMSAQQQWQVRAYGATEQQVLDTIEQYLSRKSPQAIVTDMMMSAWRETNHGLTADAVQTLNRVKLAISRFYRNHSSVFFETAPGQAYSLLSDAQELLGMEEIRQAQMVIDSAHELMLQQEKQ